MKTFNQYTKTIFDHAFSSAQNSPITVANTYISFILTISIYIEAIVE